VLTTSVPTLDAIADDPGLVRELPPHVCGALATKAAAVVAALGTRMAVAGTGWPAPSDGEVGTDGEPVAWVTAEQVEATLNIPRRWLTEHRRELVARGILCPLSRKRPLYDKAKLATLLDQERRTAQRRATRDAN
jgi:hypothetical protein